ncbi:MAG: hypothetical protein HGA27_05915 [Peptococcaceae bacterium]|nr:hypothetical protein [Peptococcaceae bacterium]
MNSIKGLILGLLLLIIPFLMGGLGGGDVKLLGVIGSIMGPSFVFTTFIFGALFGGFISLVILILNRQLLSTLGKYFPSFGFPDSYSNPKMLTLPYSIPIGLGAIYSLYSNSLLGGIL